VTPDDRFRRVYPYQKTIVERDLREVLGPERLITSPIDRRAYSRDLIVAFNNPFPPGEGDIAPPIADFVVVPETTEEVSEILRIANTHRVPVTPECGGAQGSGSTLPLHGGIVLDVKGLSRVIDIDTDNHTVTTQTGLIGGELEAFLNPHGYTTCHYPQSLHVSGVGGFLAARSAGVLSTKYGKITEMVLGMEVVLPSGEVMRTKAVPNSAAGPNFNYLFMGSEGTLGVITEATLIIRPLPESRKFLGVLFEDLPAAMNGARLIMRRGIVPAAMRVSDEMETTFFHKMNGSLMIVMFDGYEELCELELSETKKLIESLGAEDLGEGPGKTWWEEKRFSIAFPSSDHPLFGIPTPGTIRISGCIDSAGSFDYLVKVQRGLKETVEGMGMFLGAHFSHWYPTGGMIYPTFVGEFKIGPEASTKYNEVWRRGIEITQKLGGTINHHHGIGVNLGRFMRWELGDAGFENFRKIKRTMDPNHIMNPGKLGL
jgi:alkyldihydroxyacetonephosphate synthase